MFHIPGRIAPRQRRRIRTGSIRRRSPPTVPVRHRRTEHESHRHRTPPETQVSRYTVVALQAAGCWRCGLLLWRACVPSITVRREGRHRRSPPTTHPSLPTLLVTAAYARHVCHSESFLLSREMSLFYILYECHTEGRFVDTYMDVTQPILLERRRQCLIIALPSRHCITATAGLSAATVTLVVKQRNVGMVR